MQKKDRVPVKNINDNNDNLSGFQKLILQLDSNKTHFLLSLQFLRGGLCCLKFNCHSRPSPIIPGEGGNLFFFNKNTELSFFPNSPLHGGF